MVSFSLRTDRSWLSLIPGALLLLASVAFASEPPYQRDLAVYDRALADLKPGQDWVPFGDVGLTAAQLRLFRQRLVRLREAATKNGANSEPEVITPAGSAFKWPGGNVYYRFDSTQVGNDTITAPKIQQFRDSVAEWAAFANLHFFEFTGPPPSNYITVSEANIGGGFSNSVGLKGGEQLLQFDPGAWNRGTICHEVGHALGLWHEQQRPDRNTYIVLHPENLNDPNDANYTIVPAGQTFGTAYDFYSVMHYSRNALSKNGQDVITMQPAYAQYLNVIGNVPDRTLSKLDRAGMAAIYGNPATAPSAVVTNTNDSGSGSLRSAIYYAFDRSTDASPIATTITFHIPTSDANYDSAAGVFRIKPTFELTAPGNGTTIDGTSQASFAGNTNVNGPEIVLDGSNFAVYSAPPFYFAGPGLILRAANCTVKGLMITNFSNAGIDIFQGTDPTAGPATGNVVGGTTASERNIISGNGTYGVTMHDATTTGNVIKGNYIGSDQTGGAAQANLVVGLAISAGAHGNTVGGTISGAGNVVSGNVYQGLTISGSGTTQNLVQGNFIGTKANGTEALPNGSGGISINSGAQANVIGGTTAGAGNILSGNTYQGLTIDGQGTNSNLVRGNFIGTDKNGSSPLPNNSSGISIYGGAQSNVIGGVIPGARNVISGNAYQALTVDGANTNSNLVQGNFVGLDITGLTTLPNNSTNIQIYNGAQANLIGGTPVGARNYICGSPYYGIAIIDTSTTGNMVQGNSIGVNVAGVARGNGFQGVALFGGAHDNTVGGSPAGASNLISGNLSDGLAQYDSATMKNTFSRNSIDGNSFRAIVLNHGSNSGISAPGVSSSVLGPGGNASGTDVGFSWSGSAGTIEFFASLSADSSGFGEGRNFLGAITLPASSPAHLAAAVPAGNVVSATATDSLGNTSEFSNAFTVSSADNGSDGLTDAWMLQYFTHIDPRSNDSSRAGDDADGDGLSNLQEFLAGTAPNNANSRLRISSVARNANDLTVTFVSVIGKTYRVEVKNDLSATAWTLVQDQIAASSTSTAMTEFGAGDLTKRFYRVVLEP